METPPWYVITGGPCAGKTTLIGELAHRGYHVVPEAARAYLEAQMKKGRTLEELRSDEAAFQRALIPMKVAAEAAAPTDAPVFFDRGMHDSVVYFAWAGVTEEPGFADELARSRYRKIFILDPLPYAKDAVRSEEPEEARKIHADLADVYRDAGFDVLRVPVMPLSERADFVLSHL